MDSLQKIDNKFIMILIGKEFDNKFIMILIGKEFVNKFIGHLFIFLCMFRDLDLAWFISLYACYFEISMFVLTGSYKYFGKSLDLVVVS